VYAITAYGFTVYGKTGHGEIGYGIMLCWLDNNDMRLGKDSQVTSVNLPVCDAV
jgi:hypothetical protein